MTRFRLKDGRMREWKYVALTIGAYVFMPEIRRLLNWRSNLDPFNASSIIPLLMLCPIAYFAFRRSHKTQRNVAFSYIACCWITAFLYGTFIALARGAVFQPLYAFAEFCFPLIIGFWIIAGDESLQVAHHRLARALLLYAVIAAGYGIIQFVLAPPWDTLWMQQYGDAGFGKPEPFGIRVFGVLNGPGVFAMFVGAVIIFNLPNFSPKRVKTLVALFVLSIGLALSLVRAAWLAVFLGTAVFAMFTPRRGTLLTSIVAVALFFAPCLFLLSLWTPDYASGNSVTDRFTTLFNVADDGSAIERRETSETTLRIALERPIGAGLGITGGSAKLGNSDSLIFSGAPPDVIDNGFVARFFELGVPGFLLFCAASCYSLFLAASAYVLLRRQRDASAMRIISSCLALQLAVFLANASGDGQQALLGVLFFAAAALPLLRSDTEIHKVTSPMLMASQR